MFVIWVLFDVVVLTRFVKEVSKLWLHYESGVCSSVTLLLTVLVMLPPVGGASRFVELETKMWRRCIWFRCLVISIVVVFSR